MILNDREKTLKIFGPKTKFPKTLQLPSRTPQKSFNDSSKKNNVIKQRK